MIKYVFQDWTVNSDDSKGRYVMFCFRLAHFVGKNKLLKFLFIPFLIYNRIFNQWILGIEIGSRAEIGVNCRLFHGVGLVIHPHVIIGDNCILRHGVTLGNKVLADGTVSGTPKIGNNVEFGANCAIIGAVTIGDNVIVGAGCVVVKDIPGNSIAVGNPARIISRKF